jgi:hypothetical protein
MSDLHYISPSDNEDDDPLIFLYFGAQTIQKCWHCKVEKGKLQLRKQHFPFMRVRE